MATKKKLKKTSAPKTKTVVKKKVKSIAGKKKSAGKRIVIGKTVVVIKKKSKAPVKQKAKSIPRKKVTVKTKVKRPVTPVITHGPDRHLIPVSGEIHPARIEETHQLEKNYKHNEETALHFEQQKAKQIMAMTRGGGGKRIFKNRGQR